MSQDEFYVILREDNGKIRIEIDLPKESYYAKFESGEWKVFCSPISYPESWICL